MTGQPRAWSPPSARAARSRVRAHRVASRSFTQRLVEIYERALYVAIVGGLVFQAVSAGLEPTRLGPSSPDDPAVVLTQWLVVVGAVMALAVSLKIMLGFGPLLVGPATQTWLLSTPVDRRMLLHTTFTLVVLLGGATGSGIAVLFVILAGLPIDTLALWLGAGALLGACLASTAVVLQKKPVWSRTAHRSLNVSVGLLAVWAVGLSVARSVVPPLGWNSGGHSWLAIVVGCLTVVAGVAAILAFRESGNLTRASLSSGTEIATATSVSVTFLDMSILGSILLVRRTRAIGRVRSVRIRGSRVMALVMADCVRVLRMRTGPVMWLFLLPVPYVASLIGASVVLPAVHLVSAFLATDRLAGGLRLTCRSAAIRRSVGGTDREQRLAHLVLPTAGAFVWCVLTGVTTPGVSLLAGAISFVGAVMTSYRIATRPPLDYSSPAYDVGLFGPVPPGLILQLIRGPTLLLALAWLQIWIGDS